MKVGEALRRFRCEEKLTQKEVARQLSIVQQVWQRYETGQVMPTAEFITKVAQTFGVSADYLLGLSDKPHTIPPDTAALVKAISDCQKILSDALDVRP